MSVIIELKKIEKRFGTVHALKDVSLCIDSGETMALVGENGAGKSTLMKILTGAYQRDQGEIYFEGKKVALATTKEAVNLGIAQVYQQAELWPELTVGENVLLGDKSFAPAGLVQWRQAHQQVNAFLEQYGIPLRSETKLKDLRIAFRQFVAIAKVLIRKPKVIIFDEPTAVLSDNEVSILFQIIRILQNQGKTIIYISHRLEEIFALCDRITVMRDGEIMCTLNNTGLSKSDLIHHMLGREIDTMYPQKPPRKKEMGSPVLELEHVTNEKIKDISFKLYQGEILGIVGLVNSGRTELARAIFGIDKIQSGDVTVFGEREHFRNPTDAVKKGFFLAPEDRKGEALVLIRSIRENITMGCNRFSKFGICSVRKECAAVQDKIEDLHIKASSMEAEVASLSGGNQQKVVIAKALTAQPQILIFDEPTQGIDVGAKAEIYTLLEKLRQEGMSIILISSEIEEVQGMCNRTLVMREGRIAGEVTDNFLDSEAILNLMYRSENT